MLRALELALEVIVLSLKLVGTALAERGLLTKHVLHDTAVEPHVVLEGLRLAWVLIGRVALAHVAMQVVAAEKHHARHELLEDLIEFCVGLYKGFCLLDLNVLELD
ncbi:MAG: hypothetical protein ACK56I_15975, partial [bacterium]